MQTLPTFGFGSTLTTCSGTTVPVLVGTSDNGITGAWLPATVSNTSDGSYTFTPDGGQCATTASFDVTINEKPQFTISGSCEGENYVLKINQENQNDLSVFWFYEGNTVGQGNSITITTEGVYTAIATNANSCDYEVAIDVTNSFCSIQKGISVNNDGKNDFFELTNLNVKKLQIFNRYGMMVYSKLNYTNEWVGKSNDGEDLPDGTYFYVIEQASGKNTVGWIYLIRAQD